MTLEELVVQANEAKAAHEAAAEATVAVQNAELAIVAAETDLEDKRAAETEAYQAAATQLQESLDATLAYAKGNG